MLDENYPSDTGRSARVYIPAGIQHMTGARGPVYARSRHGSDDFDRGARQQRVLTSLREQADVASLIPRIPDLLAAFKATVKTDIPQDQLAKLAGLASTVDTKNIRSYVFSYPRYGSQILAPIYKYLPDATKIRADGRERLQGRSEARGHAIRARRRERLDLGPRRRAARARPTGSSATSTTTA